MRKTMILLTTLIIIALITGLFIHEKEDTMTPPPKKTPDTNDQDQTELQPEPFQPVDNETISYSLQKDELNVTYNQGNDWTKVPIKKDLLFEGEYEGNENELIDGSFVLTKDYTAFLYSEDAVQETEVKKILLTYTLDEGESWKDSVVTDSFSPMRFRKVDFLNKDFGYVILSGGRTMSQEYSTAFLTHDGGETWAPTEEPPTNRLIASGSFTDEETGFLSYGTINPEEPDVYVTQDSGHSWKKSEFHMAEKYEPVFVQAEAPYIEENQLTVLVNQGPNGDYEGGKIKGKFISEDNGLTWDFDKEVNPDDAAQK